MTNNVNRIYPDNIQDNDLKYLTTMGRTYTIGFEI